jgi:hypothetical protein
MSTVQSRTGLILPDDGGVGGDDDVDVTAQLSDSIDFLSMGIGIIHVADFASLPIVKNFQGRLAQTDNNGKVYQFNAGWQFFYAKPFGIQALTGNGSVASGVPQGVGNSWNNLIGNTLGPDNVFTPGVDNITWNMAGEVDIDILYYIPAAGAADRMGGANVPSGSGRYQTANFHTFDRASLHMGAIVAVNDVWSFYQQQNQGSTLAGCTFTMLGKFRPLG